MSRRRKKWILIAAGLAVLFAAGLIALPEILRRVAVSKIQTATGWDVAIEDIDVNLFTGRFAVKTFRLAERERADPFVEIKELNGRLQALWLLVGRLRAEEINLIGPNVHMLRTETGEFNFSGLPASPDAPEAAAPPGAQGGPLDVAVERFNLVDGALTVRQEGRTIPVVSVPALRGSIQGLMMKGGETAVEQVEISGESTVVDTSLAPPPRFEFKNVKISLANVTWPERGPADLRLTTRLPKEGTLDIGGKIRMSPMGADLHVTLAGADLTPYQSYMPIVARVGGWTDADVVIAASMEDGFDATARGDLAVGRFALGPEKQPVVAVEQIRVTGADVHWPSRIAIERLLLKKPSASIERNEKGELPLRAMFARPATESTQGRKSPTAVSSPPNLEIEIGEIAIEEGYARFVDRTVSPPFTEELSRLAADVKELSNAPGKRGKLTLQSVIGATGALELQGEVAPLGESLVVNLEGELRDFAVPRVNPYAGRILSWVANDGRLTTKIRFHLEGDQLDADSEIVMDRLNVARSGEDDEVERRIGLPLGLIVALMKNVRGEIRIDVPVSGDLGSPQFSLADAVWTAVRNSIVNLLTAPLQLIGKLFTRDGKIAGIAVDPVVFEPGTTAIQPVMEQQVKRIADFLRNSPSIKLSLSAIMSQADMTSLKSREVTAKIQRLQRKQNLSDFTAAAGRLFKQRFPDRALPKTVEEMTAALRAVKPLPEDVWRELARRRLEITRNKLVESGVVGADRLEVSEEPPTLAASGEGRVEFKILL